MLTVSNPLQTGGGVPAVPGVAQAGAIPGQAPTSQVLFPTSSPLAMNPTTPMAAPVAAPAAKPKTAVRQPAAPAAPVTQPTAPQTFTLGNGLSYDVNNNPVQQQQPTGQVQKPQQPVVTPGQQFAQSAGQAGLSADDYLKLITGQSSVSSADQATIRSNLGIDTLEKTLFAPSKSSEQIYNDAFSAAGLSDVKTKFDALQTKINQRHEQLTAAMGQVNENPWLSEASRVGRAKRLQDLASEEINNLSTQAQQYADLYNQGLSQVHDVVTRAGTDFTNNQNLNQAKLTYLEKKAQEQITAKQADNSGKLSRYLPDFLSAKAKSAKPDTIGSSESGYFSWDPTTSTFKQVIGAQPKLPPSAQEYEYAQAHGYKGNYSQYQNEDANRKASIARAGISGGLNAAQTSAAFKLADDYDKASGDFDKVTANYNRVLASAKNPSAAGDLALIFSYMKTLDPTSVVREGEFATAASAGSIPDRITAQYNKIISGERLSDSQRSDFVTRSTQLYKSAEQQQHQVDSTYSARAGQFGIPANYVVRDRSSANSSSNGTSASIQDAINTYVP